MASLLFVAACDVGEVPVSGAVTGTDAGSTGGTDSGSTGPTGVEATFNSQVKPLVARCAGAGCHSGAQPPNLTAYSLLIAKYKTKPGNQSLLVTHGIATNNQHSGMPWLSAADQLTIGAWLDTL
jgi:hypothetical protein